MLSPVTPGVVRRLALLAGMLTACPGTSAQAPDASGAQGFMVTPEAFVEGDYNTYTVVNGSATGMYNPAKPTATVHSRTETVSFLMQSASEGLRHGLMKVASSDPSICTAQLMGPALKRPNIRKTARRLFVKLNCLATKPGTATITVTVPVMSASAGATPTPVSFAFVKKCAGDASVPGLDVTLGNFMDSDDGRSSGSYVIHNGATMSRYNAKDPEARITYDTTDVHMYVSMANVSSVKAHAFLVPVVETSQPWCRVLLSGKAAHGGTATTTPQLLVFKFDCSGSGKAKVIVTIPLPDHDPLQFGFFKECRAGEIPGFDVTLSSYEPGVRASYAVKNGEPTSAYHLARKDELPLAVVREAQFKTSFYLQMSTFNSLEFEAPIVSSSDPFCLVSTSGDAASGGWIDDISSQLIINFNCVDSGTALITVAVPIQMGEKLVNSSFAFRKECRWTSTPGFDVTLGAWIKSERGTYAVRNGAATSAFSLWAPKAVVRSSQYSSIFYLQMSTNDEQDFEWPSVEASDSIVRVTLAGPASKGGTAKPASEKPVALIVKYDCMKSGSAVLTITVPLGPWNEAAFSYVKECSVGEIPGFDVTLGAWIPGDRHSYAVKNGAPTEAYDASEHVAIIRSGTPSYTFYLMNSGDSALTVDRPSIEVTNPAVAVNVSGDALIPGPLEQQARSLVLDFNCVERAKTDVIVYLRVSAGTVAFGFRKDCKPLTVSRQEADTPHEVMRQAERITNRDGASNRLGNILLGIFLGAGSALLYNKFFVSPYSKSGYERAKSDD